MKYRETIFVAKAQAGKRIALVRQVVEHDGNTAYRAQISQDDNILWEGDVLEALAFLRLGQRCMDEVERLAIEDFFRAARAREMYRHCVDRGFFSPKEEACGPFNEWPLIWE